MQALPDEQQIESLERKVDQGFAELRTLIQSTERGLHSEIIAARSGARADFRTLIAVTVALWSATILAVVGGLATHL